MAEGRGIDVRTLNMQQLQEVRRNLVQEIEMLRDGMSSLKMVQQRLLNSKLSVEVSRGAPPRLSTWDRLARSAKAHRHQHQHFHPWRWQFRLWRPPPPPWPHRCMLTLSRGVPWHSAIATLTTGTRPVYSPSSPRTRDRISCFP